MTKVIESGQEKHRFKKGRSGNPKGRPPGESLTKIASRLFDMKISVRLGDRMVRMPYLEALVQSHKTKALHGDEKSQRAFDIILRELGYYDQPVEPKPRGVLVLDREGRPTGDEWQWESMRQGIRRQIAIEEEAKEKATEEAKGS